MGLRRFGIVLVVAVVAGAVAGVVDRFLIELNVGIWAGLAALVMAFALACRTPRPKKKDGTPPPPA